jgi:hypothetical protein
MAGRVRASPRGRGRVVERSCCEPEPGAQPLVRADTLQPAALASRRRSTRTLGARAARMKVAWSSRCKGRAAIACRRGTLLVAWRPRAPGRWLAGERVPAREQAFRGLWFAEVASLLHRRGRQLCSLSRACWSQSWSRCSRRASGVAAPNPSFKRTSLSWLRQPKAAA